MLAFGLSLLICGVVVLWLEFGWFGVVYWFLCRLSVFAWFCVGCRGVFWAVVFGLGLWV